MNDEQASMLFKLTREVGNAVGFVVG